MKELSKQEILSQLVGILEDMTSDWDFDYDGGIRPETRLIGDISFESIEVVQLMVLIEQHFELKNFSSEKLLMTDGRYVEELSVNEIADFLSTQVDS